MNRVLNFLQTAQVPSLTKSSIYCFDFGSRQTRVADAQKILFNQPTCWLGDLATNSVVEFGDSALALRGKVLPTQAKLYWPVQKGLIFDDQLFDQYLNLVLKKCQLAFFPILKPWSALIAVPAAATILDREFWQSAYQKIGVNQVQLVNRCQAILANRANHLHLVGHRLIIDLGAQTTEFGLLVNQKIVMNRTINWGSELINDWLIDYFRQHQKLSISWSTAEQLKKHWPAATTIANQDPKVLVRGLDLEKQLVANQKVAVKELTGGLSELWQNWQKLLRRALVSVNEELLMAGLEGGIYLTGAGGQIPGLADWLSDQWQTEVAVSQQPALDVIQGLQQLSQPGLNSDHD